MNFDSVSFKIYLQKDDGHEIRRFCISEEYAASFDFVKNKIRIIFPSLANKDFTIYWQDNENDKIAVDCDDEYLVALSTIDHEVLRLFVSVTGDDNNNNAEANEGAASFSTVQCDGCNIIISLNKNRFKCLKCPDYDLCVDCVVKEVHPEHLMLRIPSQRAIEESGIFVVEHLKKHGSRKHHCQDNSTLIIPLVDHFNDLCFKKLHHIGSKLESSKFTCSRKHLTSRKHLASSSREREALSTEPPMAQTKQKHHHSSSKRIRKENVPNPFESIQMMLKNVLPEGVAQNVPQNVDNVLRGVTDFLATVTIDCQTENNGESAQQENKTDSKKSEQTKNQEGSSKVAMPKVPREPAVKISLPHEVGNIDSNVGDKSEKREEKCFGFGGNDGIRVRAVPETTDEVEESSASDTSVDSNSSARAEGGEPREPGWTFLETLMTNTGAIPRKRPAQTDSSAPAPVAEPLPAEVSNETSSPSAPPNDENAKSTAINSSLNKMLAMGFTNEGDWLKKLLTSQNGNIEKVLEIIMPAPVFRSEID